MAENTTTARRRPRSIDEHDEPLANTPDRRVTIRSVRSLYGAQHTQQGIVLGPDHHHHEPLSFFECLKVILFATRINILLLFIPLGIIASKLHWAPVTVFVLNFIAIIPLAKCKFVVVFFSP